MKLRPSRFRGLVQKLAVPPLLLFAPHLVNYHLIKVCVYESWLIFSYLPLQYYFARFCHMGLFQVFSSGLLKGQRGLLKGFSQLFRDARLVCHRPWVPAASFLREWCSPWAHLSSVRKAFLHGRSGEAGGESLQEAGTVHSAAQPLMGGFDLGRQPALCPSPRVCGRSRDPEKYLQGQRWG